MLIYSYKGKYCPNSTNYWYSLKNQLAMFNYNRDICNNTIDCSSLYIDTYIRHVFCSYSILCKFNNLLTNCYDVEKEYLNKNNFIEEYLLNNEDVKESLDRHCRSIYNNIRVWNNRLKNNYASLDDIKWQVANSVKFYEKKGIFKVSGINLKKNYYDFVV